MCYGGWRVFEKLPKNLVPPKWHPKNLVPPKWHPQNLVPPKWHPKNLVPPNKSKKMLRTQSKLNQFELVASRSGKHACLERAKRAENLKISKLRTARSNFHMQWKYSIFVSTPPPSKRLCYLFCTPPKGESFVSHPPPQQKELPSKPPIPQSPPPIVHSLWLHGPYKDWFVDIKICSYFRLLVVSIHQDLEFMYASRW